MKTYGIVGTQRSGSNYVCSVLRSVGSLTDPREYFSPVHIKDDNQKVLIDEDIFVFAKNLLIDVKENDWFGLKIHYLQFFEHFLKKGIKLHDVFPNIKVIFLRRSNLVYQAISLWKAELTQQWTSDMDSIRKAHYNFEEIRSRYYDLKIHDLMWEMYLTENKMPFLNIIYEDIEKNEEKFFYNLFSYLGETENYKLMKQPELRKQADQKTAEWGDRFRNEYKNTPQNQNVAVWLERTKRWESETLGDDPSIWRDF